MNTELMKAVERATPMCGKDTPGWVEIDEADWDTILAALRDLEAENARLHTEIAAALRENEMLRLELDHARKRLDRSVRILTGIHTMLYPAPIESGGKMWAFRPSSLDPHEVMQELSGRIRAIPEQIDAMHASAQACWCETCRPSTALGGMRMVLCPTCGNKRCPHAHDHRNACTNSNAVGQPGSSWEHVKPIDAQDPGEASC